MAATRAAASAADIFGGGPVRAAIVAAVIAAVLLALLTLSSE